MSWTQMKELFSASGQLGLLPAFPSQGLRITDDQWTLNIAGGPPTSGTFAMTAVGQAVTVNWNETPASLQTKLTNALGAGNAICTGTALPSGNILIVFTGTLAQASQTITLGANSLTGGGPPGVSHTVTGNATVETAPTGGGTAVTGACVVQFDPFAPMTATQLGFPAGGTITQLVQAMHNATGTGPTTGMIVNIYA